jgi:hypothetical protein
LPPDAASGYRPNSISAITLKTAKMLYIVPPTPLACADGAIEWG